MCVCVWCLYPSLKRRSFLFSIRRRESSSFVPLKEEGEIYRGADCCVTGIGKIFLGRKKQTSPLARPTVKIWLRSIHSPELDIGPPLSPPFRSTSSFSVMLSAMVEEMVHVSILQTSVHRTPYHHYHRKG